MKYEYRDYFIYNGKRYDVKAHSKRELRQKMEARRKKAESEAPALDNTLTVRAWGEYAVEQYKTNQKEITRKKFMQRVEHCIFEPIGSMRLVDVRPIHCQMVINAQAGKSKTQINEVYHAIRFIFRTALENGLVAKNPADHIVRPNGYKNHRRALTDQERDIVRIVAEKKPKYVMYLLMLECGLRPSEAAEATGADIVFRSDVPFLHVRGTKTANADRIVPIPDTLYQKIKNTPKSAYIASYSGGGKITDDNRKRMWKAFKRDMNIEMGAEMYRHELQEDLVSPDLVPYCFRHDYCSRLAKAGVDIRTAQKLMGHASIDMTANIYTHIDDSSLLDAAKKLF
jgi:integrase